MTSSMRKIGFVPQSWLVVLFFFGLTLPGSEWLLATTHSVVFVDGFENGTSCWWSQSEPPTDCPPQVLEITIDLPGGETMKLVRISPGTFLMGSREDEHGRDTDEDLHQVSLTQGFYLGVTEVTQGQWEAVTGSPVDLTCYGGPYGVGPDYPVYCVSWLDIAGPGGFVEQLNDYLTATDQTGAGLFRLPTEAEWERAARGETQTGFSFAAPEDWNVGSCSGFPEADPYMAWCGNNVGQVRLVGSKLPNPYGLHDMHGNVWEWVQDLWQEHLGYDPVVDPNGPYTGYHHVLRGGGWHAYARNCRSAARAAYTQGFRGNFTGLRLARSE